MTAHIIRFISFIALSCALTSPVLAPDDDDISLFDGSGSATAYIAPDDDMTIYLWSGKPVAYLETDRGGGFHVYGFNGHHLGWFVNGIVRDHAGNVACATKERLQATKFEPFKSFKQFKPFTSFREFSPLRPIFVQDWSETPCGLLLAQGR
jgi:4-fold beta flower protein